VAETLGALPDDETQHHAQRLDGLGHRHRLFHAVREIVKYEMRLTPDAAHGRAGHGSLTRSRRVD
jgi:hypothetical protein